MFTGGKGKGRKGRKKEEKGGEEGATSGTTGDSVPLFGVDSENQDNVKVNKEEREIIEEETEGHNNERTCVTFICSRDSTSLGMMFHMFDVTINAKKIRFVAGPHWMMLTVTFIYLVVKCGLILGLVATYTRYPAVFIIYFILLMLTLVFLALAALRDPGIFPHHPRPLGRDWTYSNQAKSFRPPGVIYCRECKLLIHDCKSYAAFNFSLGAIYVPYLLRMQRDC